MRQWRWIEILHKYEFKIKYLPAKDNVVANALSRKSFLNAVSMPNDPIIDKVKEISPNNPNYVRIIHLLQQENLSEKDKNLIQGYTLHEGCLFLNFIKGYTLIYSQGHLCRRRAWLSHDLYDGHSGYWCSQQEHWSSSHIGWTWCLFTSLMGCDEIIHRTLTERSSTFDVTFVLELNGNRHKVPKSDIIITSD